MVGENRILGKCMCGYEVNDVGKGWRGNVQGPNSVRSALGKKTNAVVNARGAGAGNEI